MKIAIVGRNTEDLVRIAEKDFGFKIDYFNPEIVISNGGDGSLLGAEHQYPGILKLGLRDSETSLKHEQTDVFDAFSKLKHGNFTAKQYIKLEAKSNNKSVVALNDISIRSSNVLSAIRYTVEINNKDYTGEIIGDGLIVSTPVGSSAYYRSITKSVFQVGIGLAFNNSIEAVDHLVLDDDVVIKTKITRGPAIAAADNNNIWINLNTGDEVVIRKHHQKATLLFIDERKGPFAFTRLV